MSTQLIYICIRANATRFTLKKNYHYYTGNKSKHNSLGEKDPKLSTSLVRSIRRRQGGSPKTYGFSNRVCHLFLSPYSFSFIFLKSVLLCHATFHWRKKKIKEISYFFQETVVRFERTAGRVTTPTDTCTRCSRECVCVCC